MNDKMTNLKLLTAININLMLYVKRYNVAKVHMDENIEYLMITFHCKAKYVQLF